MKAAKTLKELRGAIEMGADVSDNDPLYKAINNNKITTAKFLSTVVGMNIHHDERTPAFNDECSEFVVYEAGAQLNDASSSDCLKELATKGDFYTFETLIYAGNYSTDVLLSVKNALLMYNDEYLIQKMIAIIDELVS